MRSVGALCIAIAFFGCASADDGNSSSFSAALVGGGDASAFTCDNVADPIDVDPGAGLPIVCGHSQQGRSYFGVASAEDRKMVIRLGSASWSPQAPFNHPQLDLAHSQIDEKGLHLVTTSGRPLQANEYVGLMFTANWGMIPFLRTYRTRIDASYGNDVNGRPRFLVSVSNNGSPWESLCPDGDWAYAQHNFVLTNHIQSNPDAYAPLDHFACRRSAVGKATRWNYGDYWHYGAATRLAIADYCGTGQTHTVDGTEVNVLDLDGLASHGYADDEVQPVSPSAGGDPFYFEAAWHYKTGAICLSKLRWDSLPPGGFCNDVLPDPRIKGSTGKFCEDIAGPGASFGQMMMALRSAGAVVYSESQFNTRSLMVWKNDPVFLVSATPWNGNLDAAPAPGYFVDIDTYKQVAQVLSHKTDGAKVALQRYRNRTNGLYRTTTEPLADDWLLVETVGYVYSNQLLVPAELTGVRLVGWSDETDTRFLLLRSDQTPPPEYVHSRTEGWAIAPLS